LTLDSPCGINVASLVNDDEVLALSYGATDARDRRKAGMDNIQHLI
jgi:hypothetical protein